MYLGWTAHFLDGPADGAEAQLQELPTQLHFTSCCFTQPSVTYDLLTRSAVYVLHEARVEYRTAYYKFDRWL